MRHTDARQVIVRDFLKALLNPAIKSKKHGQLWTNVVVAEVGKLDRLSLIP